MKSRVVVSAIIEHRGRILLGQKSEGVGPYPNTWHLPGGGADLECESLEEAMRREIKEETGLDVATIKRASFDEDYEPDKNGEMTHYVFLRFNVTVVTDEVSPNDDLAVLKWVEKANVKDLPLTRPLAKHLKEIGGFQYT